jgi:hypothetical protein
MKDYVSITHISSNENGDQELVLEEEWPMWKFLWFACLSSVKGIELPQTKVRSYIVQGTVWAEKETGNIPNKDMQFELFECKGWCKRQQRFDDHWNQGVEPTYYE